MTADQDALEERLVAALATVPDHGAAERLRAQVDASLQADASSAGTGWKPRRPAAWLLPLLGSAVVLTILAMLSGVWSRAERRAPIEQVVPASWARGYADIADLAADADLVIEGTVRTLVTGPGGTPPMTRVGIDVARVLQGDAGASIEVFQTGGTTPDGSWVVLGDPPMEVGDHALLFLRRIDGGVSAGAYMVLGGPQGRFDVADDGTIGPVGDPSVTLSPGTTVDDVAARIAALDAAALKTCEAVKGSVPLAIVRSGTPTVVSASTVTGARLERYLGSVSEGASSSPLGMTDEATMCLIEGDFVMRTPGPPGHNDRAKRILVIVTDGRPQLWSWTRTPTALPTPAG